MHTSDSGYSRYQSDWTGPMEMLPFRPDPFRMLIMAKQRIEDSMAAFVCHGAFTRFLELRVASIENGGDRVAPFLEHLEDVHRKMPQAFDEEPVDAFKRNVHISPFDEDDIEQLVDVMGADNLLFGSDWPAQELERQGMGDVPMLHRNTYDQNFVAEGRRRVRRRHRPGRRGSAGMARTVTGPSPRRQTSNQLRRRGEP